MPALGISASTRLGQRVYRSSGRDVALGLRRLPKVPEPRVERAVARILIAPQTCINGETYRLSGNEIIHHPSLIQA